MEVVRVASPTMIKILAPDRLTINMKAVQLADSVKISHPESVQNRYSKARQDEVEFSPLREPA